MRPQPSARLGARLWRSWTRQAHHPDGIGRRGPGARRPSAQGLSRRGHFGHRRLGRSDLRRDRPRRPLEDLLDGKVIPEPWKAISYHGPSAIGHVVYHLNQQDLVSSPGNRIVKPTAEGRAQAKGWLSRVEKGVLADVLKSHAIPEDAYLALVKEDDAAKFVRLRQENLIALERAFMKRQNVTPPDQSTGPELAPIDADDETPPSVPLEEGG